MGFEYSREAVRCELASLVGVKDISFMIASSRASMQKEASRVFDNLQDNTFLLAQSMTATR
jgi:hypothetical protein